MSASNVSGAPSGDGRTPVAKDVPAGVRTWNRRRPTGLAAVGRRSHADGGATTRPPAARAVSVSWTCAAASARAKPYRTAHPEAQGTCHARPSRRAARQPPPPPYSTSCTNGAASSSTTNQSGDAAKVAVTASPRDGTTRVLTSYDAGDVPTPADGRIGGRAQEAAATKATRRDAARRGNLSARPSYSCSTAWAAPKVRTLERSESSDETPKVRTLERSESSDETPKVRTLERSESSDETPKGG